MRHDIVEKNSFLMVVLTVCAISLGGLAEIVPLYFMKETTEPVKGLKPLTALQQVGRDIYIRESCNACHSQMIRPFRAETERYGPYSVAGEFVWDYPFLWGSKRTGPDLARVGGRYSDEWHIVHLIDPRQVVPESNMPGFPWLAENMVDASTIKATLRVMQGYGVPYEDDYIENKAEAELEGKTEMDALVAYLQNLGTVLSNR